MEKNNHSIPESWQEKARNQLDKIRLYLDSQTQAQNRTATMSFAKEITSFLEGLIQAVVQMSAEKKSPFHEQIFTTIKASIDYLLPEFKLEDTKNGQRLILPRPESELIKNFLIKLTANPVKATTETAKQFQQHLYKINEAIRKYELSLKSYQENPEKFEAKSQENQKIQNKIQIVETQIDELKRILQHNNSPQNKTTPKPKLTYPLPQNLLKNPLNTIQILNRELTNLKSQANQLLTTAQSEVIDLDFMSQATVLAQLKSLRMHFLNQINQTLTNH